MSLGDDVGSSSVRREVEEGGGSKGCFGTREERGSGRSRRTRTSKKRRRKRRGKSKRREKGKRKRKR